jgi:hypothetical protein
VFSARNYSVGNVLYVITGRSVVVIDTTEKIRAAQACLDDFRGRCDLPVRRVVYTHHHGDHVRGASVFVSADTEVIGHRQLPTELMLLDRIYAYRQIASATKVIKTRLRRPNPVRRINHHHTPPGDHIQHIPNRIVPCRNYPLIHRNQTPATHRPPKTRHRHPRQPNSTTHHHTPQDGGPHRRAQCTASMLMLRAPDASAPRPTNRIPTSFRRL